MINSSPEIYTAPETYPKTYNYRSMFLAGSIEMDNAEDWQQRFIKEFEGNRHYSTLRIFNPRREQWDSSWDQNINSKNFYEQVTWELDALDNSDVIAMYFDPDTKSPISLMELGLYSEKKKLAVCCPDGFWRKGNVDIVCQRYNIPVFTDWNTWIVELKRKLK